MPSVAGMISAIAILASEVLVHFPERRLAVGESDAVIEVQRGRSRAEDFGHGIQAGGREVSRAVIFLVIHHARVADGPGR